MISLWLWSILVMGQPQPLKIDSVVCCEVPDYEGMGKQNMTDLFWTKTVCDTFPRPIKIDSCFVLPHDTVVCRSVNLKTDRPLRFRGNLITTTCDTIRIGNNWIYRVIRGKDTSWLQKKLK